MMVIETMIETKVDNSRTAIQSVIKSFMAVHSSTQCIEIDVALLKLFVLRAIVHLQHIRITSHGFWRGCFIMYNCISQFPRGVTTFCAHRSKVDYFVFVLIVYALSAIWHLPLQVTLSCCVSLRYDVVIKLSNSGRALLQRFNRHDIQLCSLVSCCSKLV